MKTRIITGLLVAIVALLMLYKTPLSLTTSFILCLAMLAYQEYDRLFFEDKSLARQLRQSVLIFLTILAIQQSQVAGWISAWIALVCLFICHVLAPSKTGDFTRAVRDVSMEMMGFWYIVGLFGFMMPLIQTGPLGRNYLLLLFIIVFLGDTAAFFVGKQFGKHSLAKRVSPKKTIEGAIGAGVAAILGTLFWLYVIAPEALERPHFALKLLLFAPVASALAQLGDLFESVLKRSQDAKDSGSFLPGHGGILDRMDGLALSSPVFYFYVVFILERA